MKLIYSVLITAILTPLFFMSFKHKETTNLEKHQKLREHYVKLMEYHLQENIGLDQNDPEEKELGLIHIELDKEYTKLYLRETGIVYVLQEEIK